MNFPSKNMYDTFKDEIWKELGPLDPDWFEALTAQTFTTEGNVSDQEDLCANQEGNFKTPFDKTAVDSQLFSTPKVFRHRSVVSPDTENEQSFTAEQEKEKLPWTETQSPCLFQMSKEGVPGAKYGDIQPQSLSQSFDLLQTPQKSPVSYAKQISESLGVQIHPDMSWTSSLNTPPGAPSTLILTKTDESVCLEAVPADKNVVFVRELFPSLSNPSRVGVVSPKNSDMPTVHQGVCSPDADHNLEPHDSSKSPLNQSNSGWRQTLPDAIEDREIRSTVANVLKGAENVLSIFFTNSNSTLRKVKTERIKRRQIIPAEEPGCSSTDISTPNNPALSEQPTADQEPQRLPSSTPVNTGGNGTTQWSPLSLSEIPPCTGSCYDNGTATQLKNNILTEKLRIDSDSCPQVGTPLKITDSSFTKKKRKFVYMVKASKQVQEKETQPQKMDSSPRIADSGQDVKVKQLGKSSDEADCFSVRKDDMQKQENPPPVRAKVQDLDMSQLCRDFAQDFSQMSDPGQLSKVAEDTPQNGFSPSACLSAMKQAKHKAKQANFHHDCDGVSYRRHISATNQSNLISEVAISDSGFQSAVTDMTLMTATSFVLPSSENNVQSQLWSGFRTDIHGTTPFLSTSKGNGKAHLDNILQDTETVAKLSSAIEKSETLGPDREGDLHMEKTSTLLPSRAKGTADNIDCIPLNGQVRVRLPEKTTVSLPSVHGSGFKTASNKGIHISSANLQRAKRLFEDTEGERTSSDQPSNSASNTKEGNCTSHGSVKNTFISNQPTSSNINCQLTASQKADVTELCTLLEEAGSQFDFTQFKTEKLNVAPSSQKVDREIDPDFLAGIDFDDSFSSEAEKIQAVTAMRDNKTLASDNKTCRETSNITSDSTGLSLLGGLAVEESSAEDVPSSSKHMSAGSSSIMSAELKSLDSAGHTETSKPENKNPFMPGVGFKTAGGNVLRVSKKCLSKARALFADLEENLTTSQDSPDKRGRESDAKTQHKHSVDNLSGNVLDHKEDHSDLKCYGNDAATRSLGCLSNIKESVCADRPVTDIRDKDATSFQKGKIDTKTCQSGFQMASGKGISISAKAMEEADSFFKDCDSMDSNVCLSEKPKMGKEPLPVSNHNLGLKDTPAFTNAAVLHGNLSLCAKTLSSLSCATPKNIESFDINKTSSGDGFCRASGEKVFVSADAMKKAERLSTENQTLEDTSNRLEHKGDPLRAGHLTEQIQVKPPKTVGFQTASGKGVSISSAALKKAQTLLSECDAVEDKISVKPALSKMQVPRPAPRSGGFLAASGKPVALSAEALQKAKALFSDISISEEISDTRNSDKKQHIADNTEKIHLGFSTAGGAKVHVSQEHLLKAKTLLKEFDDGSISAKEMQETDAFFKDDNNGISVKHNTTAPVNGSGNGSERKNLNKFKPDQRVTNISEEPGHERTEFENVRTAVNQEKILRLDGEIHTEVFKNTPYTTSAASAHGNPSLMTTSLSFPSSTPSNNIGSSAISELSTGGGFCTAGGKKVSVSDEAITKARSLLSESDAFEDTKKQLKQKGETLPPQRGGFQTASGKGVNISSAALKKAKNLLSECDEVEDKNSVKPTHFKMPGPAPPPRSGGFLAASGKAVALSSEALRKAKALFSDIELSEEVPAVSHKRNSDKKQDNVESLEKMQFGFTTAGGAKVHVSEENLMKAKTLLKEFADGECHDSKSDVSEVKDVKRTLNSNPAKACDKEMPAEESAPQVLNSLTSSRKFDNNNETLQNSSLRGCQTPTDAGKNGPDNLHGSPAEEISCVLDHEIHQTTSSVGATVKRTDESSVLHFQSLNLSGFSETQQKFLAQEALDCAKALLEDEGEMQLENAPLQDNPKSSNISVEEHKGKGKRRVEEPDVTGQPPLKRRLLEEFDRTVDGPRGSALHPEISCPNGLMKDRRVFKYSVSLHPNITKPHKSGNQYLETRLQKTTPTQHTAPGESRSAQSRMPAFVPPFLKNAKTESRKNTTHKDNIRTPAFVPPFKKQRTIVQESSSKPQEEEEDKHHNSVVMPSKSNAFVPPIKQTRSTANVAGNTSKEENQMVALEETTNNSMINIGSDDSAAKTSHVEDMSESQDMLKNLHNVELARDMQDMRIRKKKRQTIRPLPGSLFLTKTSGVSRIPLKAAVNGKPPAKFTQKQLYGHGVHQHVCEITSETAESFRLRLQQFIRQEAFIDGGGVQLADGGWLIPSNDGTAGKQEFYRALCDTPGVDPKLISEEWVFNHYRWIVWKQASMERSFPETMGSLCLTPEQVLLQLKYRYDVEVDHSRRPALRKIMEKDDTAAKTLVLCVSGVVSRGRSPKRRSFSDTKTPEGAEAKVENPSAVVWLTDGWYHIKAQLDEPLTAMLHKGRLAVGGKLIIHGAQLVGSQDACSPLEAPESLMLKICANSSRPTRWDVKLGFHRDPRPFLLPVSSLYSHGGPVGCVDIVILRSYPIQWMERKPDGGVVFRSVRAEEKEARRYNSQKQKSMEILFAKIQAQFEKEEKGIKKPQRRRRTISHQDVARLQDGEELYEAVGEDPAYLEAHLSEQQLETLRSYRRSLMEKTQAELQDRYRQALEKAEESEGSCPKRDVTPVWRLCFADCMVQTGGVSQLNLWRPSSDLQSLLKEGCRYKVYNLTTSEGKKLGGSTTVQLTGTKKTQFEHLQASQEWLSTHFQPRVSTHFVDLQHPEFQPLCGEVDLTGYVISIVDGQGSSPAFYLADKKLNFIKVRCFSSLAQSGLEDVVKPRVLLALSNLQLRGQSTHPTPVVYAGDLTVFSTNPKEVHLRESLSQLRTLVQGQQDFLLTAEERLSHLVSSDGKRSISSPALPDRRQSTKTTVTSQHLVRGSFTPVSRNPPAPNCSAEKDPSSRKRRRALDYLSRIPSPPPLNALGSIASPCVNKTFNPPRRSGTPSTLKTEQTPARKPVNPPVEEEWVNDEELAMIDTQDLLVGGLL